MRRLSQLSMPLVVTVLFSLSAQASLRQYASPDYYLGGVVRSLLAIASKVGYHQYDVLNEPGTQSKAQNALQQIYTYPAFSYRYDRVQIVIIRGLEDEPNGFSFGANIFLTRSLVELLSDQELTAVIAHELAHSEKAHFLQKAPLPLGAVIYQLTQMAKSVQTRQWPAGQDLSESIKELISTGGLAMEMQADCIAAQQLTFMQAQGLNHNPHDLISATSKMLGYDVTTDDSEDPSAVRTRALLNKTYTLGSCDIF